MNDEKERVATNDCEMKEESQSSVHWRCDPLTKIYKNQDKWSITVSSII